jgi:hypothetical protein
MYYSAPELLVGMVAVAFLVTSAKNLIELSGLRTHRKAASRQV